MRVSVIIITLDRPAYLRQCLGNLAKQTQRPFEIIVVDASKQDTTATMLREEFPHVVYLRNERGYGNMPMSRNIGIMRAEGDIIAFIDDDAFAEPQWIAELANAYQDKQVGAVGGRAMNGVPGEATQGVNEIGKIRRDGFITQNFAADPGKTVDVDIIIGCNMSFRREVLARLGGFREQYTATCTCEETDMCLRVRKLGYTLRFNPAACVRHMAAPQAVGSRLDLRFDLFGTRNYLMLLVLNYGFFTVFFWRALGRFSSIAMTNFGRKVCGACLSFACRIFGVLGGVGLGLFTRLVHGATPERRDAEGEEIRKWLSRPRPQEAQSKTVAHASYVSL